VPESAGRGVIKVTKESQLWGFLRRGLAWFRDPMRTEQSALHYRGERGT
jgi:hypothetical protein